MEPKLGDDMRCLFCILIALLLAGECFAGQILRGSGGSTPGATYTLVGTTTSVNGSLTTTTITKPSGTEEGDILIVAIAADNGATVFTDTGGLTKLTSEVTGGANFKGIALYKIMGSSEPSTYTITTDVVPSASVVSATLRKSLGTWNIFDEDINDGGATAVTSITSPSVTTSDSSIVLTAAYSDGALTVTTPPANMTYVNYTSVSSSAVVLYYEDRNSGTHSGESVTWSGSEQTGMISIVLRAE